ncbi:MAG: CHAD domain-containing protein [Gemmataceae bacterium]|nr:CHAD domain-containing protein [Gemmataceae bacterium]MCI0741286.1 CHAD domain-containing protein [Gemmataceae bacterium]
MSDSKWMPGLRCDMPVAAAARHVLLVRLGAVRDSIEPAALHADDDMENVHQLRVATRRAGAALRIFQICLPENSYDKARKRLRKLRRAAGAARDWDVFLLSVVEHMSGATTRRKPGLDLLAGIAHGQRSAAQETLKDATKKSSAWEKLNSATVAALRMQKSPSSPKTLRELALPALGQLLKELENAAATDLEDYGNLHQVRILGKRLRYAMEVFSSCFHKAFRETHYNEVEEMQEILGLANDSYVAAKRLEGIRRRLQATQSAQWKRYRPGVESLLLFHEQRFPAQRQRFLEWWQRWRQSGAEQRFGKLLASP